MHIPRGMPSLAGIIPGAAPLSANARKPAEKRRRRVEDTDDSLLDVVILSDHEHPEDRDEEDDAPGQ